MTDFLWGAATSAHQIEGDNRSSDWWEWEHKGNIEGGVVSGKATNHWDHFREDLKAAKDLGLNSYRFSIEWAKIEPTEGSFDQSAIQWYRDLIAECEKNALIPMATLHHFTSPAWFAKKGGFAQADSPQAFLRFVSVIADDPLIGARIPLWCTLNEPMVLAMGGYIGRFMPPAIFSPQTGSLVIHHLIRSHVNTYDLLHKKLKERTGPWKHLPLQVGIAHNMLDFLPDRKGHPIETVLAIILHRFYNLGWLDAITGKPPKINIPFLFPKVPLVPEALGRKTTDFIGINYYTKAYLKWRPRDASESELKEVPIGLSFARRKEVQSDLNWAIHPQGLEKMIKVVSKYKMPIYITENGIADKSDQIRSEFLIKHLETIAHMKSQGHDIRGYYHWSLIDNFEWIKGFGPRFGLYEVNYETFSRELRPSARVYQNIIREHGDRGPTTTLFESTRQ